MSNSGLGTVESSSRWREARRKRHNESIEGPKELLIGYTHDRPIPLCLNIKVKLGTFDSVTVLSVPESPRALADRVPHTARVPAPRPLSLGNGNCLDSTVGGSHL